MSLRRIAVTRETRPNERRVILLPREVGDVVEAGFEVLVERGAGAGIGVGDDAYARAGATIASRERVWGGSDVVVKYKAPTEAELPLLRRGLHLGGLFHAEGDLALTQALCDSGVTAYSYEFFRSADGGFPLAHPGGEVAGKLAVLHGAYYLQTHLGGRGVLLADVADVEPPRVLVIGHGKVGGAAVRAAEALGAQVTVLGRDRAHLRRFRGTVSSRVRCRLNSAEVLREEAVRADLVIGAILISTYDTEPMLTRDIVEAMRPGTVLVDATAGYGPGYLPTFTRETTLDEPVFERCGVVHCKIDVLPSAVPITTATAMSATIAPYLLALARSVYDGEPDPPSQAGKIVEDGRITHPEVERHVLHHAA
jgi:alanine dehydrogenase